MTRTENALTELGRLCASGHYSYQKSSQGFTLYRLPKGKPPEVLDTSRGPLSKCAARFVNQIVTDAVYNVV